MFMTGRQSTGIAAAMVMAMATSGCLSLGKKKEEAAVDAPPPPPAAYPDTSGSMMAGSTPSSAVPAPSSATAAATNRPSAASATPVPFSLREGEQLVPHLIQPGEYLSTIASKYNTTVGRIQSANGMTDTKIFAGKTIQVPTSAAPLASGLSGAPSGGGYGAEPAPAYSGPVGGGYPSATAPPTPSAPSYPTASVPGAITAPPVPEGGGGLGDPAATSYPRTNPVPSFEASRVQFSN